MKQFKKMLSTGLACLTCLAVVSLTTQETQAYDSSTDKGSPSPTQIRANEAYSHVIGAVDIENMDKYEYYYGLFDLDNNGVEELIFASSWDDLEIWSYENGSAVKKGSFFNLYSAENPAIKENMDYFLDMGYGYLYAYPLENGSVTLVHRRGSSQENRFTEDKYFTMEGGTVTKTQLDTMVLQGTTTYFENHQEISKSAYDQKVAALTGDKDFYQLFGLGGSGRYDLNYCDTYRLVKAWDTGTADGREIYYPDVPRDTWYTDAVVFNSYYVFGAMGAVDGDNFLPNANASRGAVAQTLFNYCLFNWPGYQGEPDSVKNFADAIGTKYELSVHWAKGNDLMSGYSDDYFAVFHDVSRQELAAILYKGHNHDSIGVNKIGAVSANTSLLNQYSDASSVADWAKEAVSWCVANDIMTGYDGKIAPNSPVTRAQLAVMM